MKIRMPVEVLTDRCAKCPDLDINVITTINTKIADIDEKTGKIASTDECTNALQCANYEVCKKRFELVLKAPEEKKDITKPIEKPKSVTKKAETKKPIAKKATSRK